MLKNVSLFILLSISFIAATVLETVVNATKAGNWRSVTTNLTYEMTHAGPVSDVIYAFGENCHWEPNARELYFIGSPHGTIGKFIAYDEATNNWTQPPTFREPQSHANRVGHAYDQSAVDTKRGHYYHQSYVGPDYLFRYRSDLKKWDTVHTTGTWSTGNYRAMEYFPELDAIISCYGADGNVQKLDIETLTWSFIQKVSAFGFHSVMEYNPVFKCIVFGGGDNTNALYKMDTNMTITSLTTCPIPLGLNCAHLSVDPVSGDLIVLGDGGNLRAYDMVTKEWKTCSILPASFATYLVNITAHHSVFGQIPELGCNVLLNQSPFPMLIYKHSDNISIEKSSDVIRSEVSVKAYPNPFNPIVNISISGNVSGLLKVHIYNKLGVKVHSADIDPSGVYNWNASSLSSGMYVAKIISKTGDLEQKIKLVIRR